MSLKQLLTTASTITRVFGLFGFVLPLGVAISALAQEPEEHPVTFHVAGGLTTITGSDAGVYDGLPWINDLMVFLRNARRSSKLIGICFGHQVMAQAFGSSVIKSPKGWGIGLHRYELHARPYWMDDAAAVAVPASHQDQVVTLPSDARVIASSEFTPYAGLDYGGAISFQFHPEFSPAFATALIEANRDRYGALATSAIQSHLEPDDCARVGRWIGRFLDFDEAPHD